jgi:hypothetical protein
MIIQTTTHLLSPEAQRHVEIFSVCDRTPCPKFGPKEKVTTSENDVTEDAVWVSKVQVH